MGDLHPNAVLTFSIKVLIKSLMMAQNTAETFSYKMNIKICVAYD
jgi:hypothetical protein